MTEAIPNDAETVFNKLMRLFGRPPLLRNERLEDFKDLFEEFFAALGPDDFLMHVHVYHFTIETWSLFRLMRYGAAVVNKCERDQRATWAVLDKVEAAVQGMKEIEAKSPSASDTDPQYLNGVAELKADVTTNRREEIGWDKNDLNYVDAFDYSNVCLERIEMRISRTLRRRETILRQIAMSRVVLSGRLRKISDNIIEGTSRETPTSNVRLIPQASPHGQSE